MNLKKISLSLLLSSVAASGVIPESNSAPLSEEANSVRKFLNFANQKSSKIIEKASWTEHDGGKKENR